MLPPIAPSRWLSVQGEGRITRFQKAENESKTMFSTLILRKVTETPSKGIINESLLSDYVRYVQPLRLNSNLVEEGHCLLDKGQAEEQSHRPEPQQGFITSQGASISMWL